MERSREERISDDTVSARRSEDGCRERAARTRNPLVAHTRHHQTAVHFKTNKPTYHANATRIDSTVGKGSMTMNFFCY